MKKIKKYYKDWHDYDNHLMFHWLIFILIAITLATLLWGETKDWLYSDIDQPIVGLTTAKTTLLLEPQVSSVVVGDRFTSSIILDTSTVPIDAVDIYALHYDPTILKVIDGIATQAGTQITPGPIMGATAVNIVDESKGSIKFGRLTQGGEKFTGSGVLATIRFEAIAPGTSYLKFDFEKGNTVDTNVAYKGKDRLVKVVDAIYSVSAQ